MTQAGIEYSVVGKRIKERREALALTQKELADLVGVSPSFIGHLERAEKIPSVETLAKLCAAVDMSMDYLLFGTIHACDREKCELFRDLQSLMAAYSNRVNR